MHTPPKISQLDQSSWRNHDILWLDIAMDDVIAMQEAYSIADLPDDPLHFLHSHSIFSLLHQGIERLLASVLLDQIDTLLVMKDTVQFYDVEIVAEALDLKLRG